MHCPHCRRRLWRSLVKSVAAPSAEPRVEQCPTCTARVKVLLPYYLTDQEYVALGGLVMGLSLALLLTVDVDLLLKLQLLASALLLFVGGLAVVTWYKARLK